MPVVLLVGTVPLVALAPIITLLFGTGFACVAVMSGVVVLLPALVTVAYGLRSVAYPSALPSISAAVRISVPGAITGALIAEFFTTTTDSVGKAVNTSLTLCPYDQLWAPSWSSPWSPSCSAHWPRPPSGSCWRASGGRCDEDAMLTFPRGQGARRRER